MCIRCGTGAIAWCTDPSRHGDKIHTDSEALDKIAVVLRDNEWDADSGALVARLVAETGRPIDDTGMQSSSGAGDIITWAGAKGMANGETGAGTIESTTPDGIWVIMPDGSQRRIPWHRVTSHTPKDEARTCAWCSVTAKAATMEPISTGPSVACRDTKACQDRIVAKAARAAEAIGPING